MYVYGVIGEQKQLESRVPDAPPRQSPHRYTPSPPTKSFPTKSPRVEVSGRPPIKLYRHENSHPLELRVCLSQTL